MWFIGPVHRNCPKLSLPAVQTSYKKTTEMKFPPYLQTNFNKPPPPKTYPPEDHADYDSDSSQPILYRDDPMDDDEDEPPSGGLAAKVMRKDTLAMRLGTSRSDGEEEPESLTVPHTSEEERSNGEEKSHSTIEPTSNKI